MKTNRNKPLKLRGYWSWKRKLISKRPTTWRESGRLKINISIGWILNLARRPRPPNRILPSTKSKILKDRTRVTTKKLLNWKSKSKDWLKSETSWLRKSLIKSLKSSKEESLCSKTLQEAALAWKCLLLQSSIFSMWFVPLLGICRLIKLRKRILLIY
jgi:hypothetical protein